MTQENVELVHRVADALDRREIDAALAIADPEIEYSPCLVELEGAALTAATTVSGAGGRAGSAPLQTSARRSRRSETLETRPFRGCAFAHTA